MCDIDVMPAGGLTDGEKEEYYAAFRMFDTDDSGTISTNELGKVMKLLGKNPTDTELNGESTG